MAILVGMLVATPRRPGDTERWACKIEQQKNNKEIAIREIMDAQDKRIEKILGSECERNSENALKYLDHLQRNIKDSCILTGVEDFPWEEPYVMGGWSQKKYEKLKKNNPSYTD